MRYYCEKCGTEFRYKDEGNVDDYCNVCGHVEIIPIPDYETLERYKNRTGKVFPDDGAVWIKCSGPNMIDGLEVDGCIGCDVGKSWRLAYAGEFVFDEDCHSVTVTADPPVPPKDDWEPPEEIF